MYKLVTCKKEDLQNANCGCFNFHFCVHVTVSVLVFITDVCFLLLQVSSCEILAGECSSGESQGTVEFAMGGRLFWARTLCPS